MEEKESTVSGSPGNSDTDSPTPVSSLVPQPQMMDVDMVGAAGSTGMERSDVAGGAMSVVPAAVSAGGAGGQGNGGGGAMFVKKKRGRPRRYDGDGNLRVQLQPLMHHSVSGAGGVIVPPPPPPSGFSFSSSSPPPSDDQVFSSPKRGRGRPSGSGNWQLLPSLGELFANTAGGDFSPHVVTVYAGEDVAGKILSFSHKSPRGICVLSANGAVSNVTIRQPGSSGGILTYEA
ncbi:hypothetical protein Tsubulata_029662 [Turnera subulata]|uniref:AT-hook motif nuclear-localized protein n=1 Tax=Turnera subulata TaxID=218843 RepID=A0A9Q0JJQ8_9ROSI|nr:hypothetical protein Tsubulata_029662 [Turnera subulata]